MINKIKLRLTFFNTIIVLSIVFAMSVFIYIIVNVNSIANTDEQLADMAYQLKRYVNYSDGRSVSAEISEEYALFARKAERQSISYGMWDYNDRQLISKLNGIAAPSEAMSMIRKSLFTVEPGAERVVEEPDGTYYIHVYRFEDYDLRVCTVIFAGDTGKLNFAQTSIDMNTRNDMVKRVRNALFISAALSVALCFVSGYFLAGRAIVPIQESIKRQNEFFADASHELRTPITIIRTNLDVVRLSGDELVSSQSEWLDNAYSETERMERLVKDLLSVSKADLDMDTLVTEEFDLLELIKNIVDKFTPLAQSRGVKLALDCVDAEYPITADKMKTEQMITIVTDNAFRYSGDGKKISFALEKDEANYTLRISDEGIGIDEVELEKIFNRFYRTDKARSRAEGGTGLGLAIARRIAEQHGGTIVAESVKKCGTTIVITLPQIRNTDGLFK